jgi:hypothetical protein
MYAFVSSAWISTVYECQSVMDGSIVYREKLLHIFLKILLIYIGSVIPVLNQLSTT